MDETASNVARAIAASLDWSSTPDARKAAVAYLESLEPAVRQQFLDLALKMMVPSD